MVITYLFSFNAKNLHKLMNSNTTYTFFNNPPFYNFAGDIVNRKIVDYFAQMTAPDRIGSYIESLKQSLWPDG